MAELGEVRIAGSLLAALIRQAVSSPGGNTEGLLLGVSHEVVQAVTEDHQEATQRSLQETDLTGYICTGCRESFYNPMGHIRPGKLREATQKINPDHNVVGWFISRRNLLPRPSLRDLAVLKALTQQLGKNATGGGVEESKRGDRKARPSSNEQVPLVTFILSMDLQASNPTQSFDYACYYLPNAHSQRCNSLSVKIRNVAHDSTTEYRTYTGGYYPSLLRPPPLVATSDASIMEQEGGAAAASSTTTTLTPGDRIGVPMRSGLAALARAVPAPHVEECELYLDQIIDRLNGLVEEIRIAEVELGEEKRNNKLLRQILSSEERETEGKSEEKDEEGREGGHEEKLLLQEGRVSVELLSPSPATTESVLGEEMKRTRKPVAPAKGEGGGAGGEGKEGEEAAVGGGDGSASSIMKTGEGEDNDEAEAQVEAMDVGDEHSQQTEDEN